MKKALIIILAVIMAYSVLAVSVDQECRDNGFDFGYAKYDLDESRWELGSMFSRNYVEVDGDVAVVTSPPFQFTKTILYNVFQTS